MAGKAPQPKNESYGAEDNVSGIANVQEVPEQNPHSPGVKVDQIAPTSFGPDTEMFYHSPIGMGDKCIPDGKIPDVGDYEDDDVSKPEGPLFDGPQAWPSSQLHSGVDAEK